MQRSLRIVASNDGLNAESVFEKATMALPPGARPEAAIEQGDQLARETLIVLRREQEPALLASVALVIPDQSVKVAFLEAIGAAFLSTLAFTA